MAQDSTNHSTSVLLSIAALVIIIAGLKEAAPMVAQFLMSLFIAVITTPAIRWMETKKVPRALAITLVLIGILLLVYLIVALVGDSIESFSQQKEIYAHKFESRLNDLVEWLSSIGIPAQHLELSAAFEKLDVMALVTRVVGGLGVIFGDFFIIFLSVAFILSETASFPAKFSKAFSNSQEKMIHVNKALEKIRHYLALKTAASLLTGFLISILLFIIGVDYAFLWGVLAFLLNFIPNIGSIIAAIPALMLALIQLGPLAMLWTAVSFFAVNNFVGTYLEPKFMGKALGLSAFVIFLSNQKTQWMAIMLGPEK